MTTAQVCDEDQRTHISRLLLKEIYYYRYMMELTVLGTPFIPTVRGNIITNFGLTSLNASLHSAAMPYCNCSLYLLQVTTELHN